MTERLPPTEVAPPAREKTPGELRAALADAVAELETRAGESTRWQKSSLAWAIIGACIETGVPVTGRAPQLISKALRVSVGKDAVVSAIHRRLGNVRDIKAATVFRTLAQTGGVPSITEDDMQRARTIVAQPFTATATKPAQPVVTAMPPVALSVPSLRRVRTNPVDISSVPRQELFPDGTYPDSFLTMSMRFEENPLALCIVEESIRQGLTLGPIGKLLFDGGFLYNNSQPVSPEGFTRMFGEEITDTNQISRRKFLQRWRKNRTSSIPKREEALSLARSIVKKRKSLIQERSGIVLPEIQEE